MAPSDDFRKRIDTIARECIGMRARLLDRAVTNVFNAELEPFGVKLSQMNVLIAIAKLEPARPADVSEALYLEASTLSRNVERLRSRGFVSIGAGSDARSRRYRLTNTGRTLIEEVFPRWRDAQRRARKMLGQEGTKALLTFSRERPFQAKGR